MIKFPKRISLQHTFKHNCPVMVDLTRLVMTSPLVLVLILMTSLWSPITDAEPLNDYILDYQPLIFNPFHLEERHQRVRRSADPFLRWNFKAYGRTFNLRLEPAKSIFTPDHHLVVDDTTHNDVDTSFIYEGSLTGDPTSRVHMAIHNGSVMGFIQVPGHTVYHMEPADKYFKNPQFPSIIYPETRMNLDPYRHKRAAAHSHDGSCYSSSIREGLKKMAQPLDEPSTKRKKRDLTTFEMNNPYAKYSADLNKRRESHRRVRRDLRAGLKTCIMSIRADELLYKHILINEGNAERAKKALVSMFALHISAINAIYENTDFKRKTSDSSGFRGVRFQLQRSSIVTECSGTWEKGYCEDNLDVSNFLDLTSLKNHDEFCLVHTFTYRDFVGGTLGLAWVATPDSRTSGVCGKYGRVSDNGKITSKSLNTGITTLINFNRDVASRVSQLTFAHEVGHNFGAEHDKTSECAPYGTSQSDASDGNYIMYPSANTGNLPHNSEFSDCSKDYVAQVLENMEPNGRRAYCFKASDAAFCGNNIVEGDEECDCGYQDECDDKCCNGRPNEGMDSSMCTRKPNIQCSPSQGPCCTENCMFSSGGDECLTQSDCTEAASCVVNNASCPAPTHKPDIATFCDSFDRVCVGGECIGSVCQNISWTECFMKDSEVSDKEEMCYVSCRKDTDSKCVSSYDTDEIDKPEYAEFKKLLETIQNGKGESDDNLGVKRPAGSACNYGKGYCDIFSKCRGYDAEGPFRQLTKLIFNPVTFENIEEWIIDHWWAVLLMGIGVIVFMAVFVKLFGYNTPSEDPKKKRRAQPMPRTNPNANKRGASRQQGHGGVYATDVPMHDNQGYGGRSQGQGGRGQGQGGRGQGQVNQGYQSYQDYHPYEVPQGAGGNGYSGRGSHQQFDRIAGPRRY